VLVIVIGTVQGDSIDLWFCRTQGEVWAKNSHDRGTRYLQMHYTTLPKSGPTPYNEHKFRQTDKNGRRIGNRQQA
jgi:hypothetical protein